MVDDLSQPEDTIRYRVFGQRCWASPGSRQVYETLVDGDIIIRTDGQTFGNGMLYEATFASPGEFAPTLGEVTLNLNAVNGRRGRSDDPDCVLTYLLGVR